MNSNLARERRPRRRSRVRSFVTVVQVIILLFMGTTVGVGLGLFLNLSRVLPQVQDFQAPEATIVYSSDGVVLGRVFREDRTNVPLKEIPQSLRDATIAIEDSRFYEHAGVDVRGIARAVWTNVRGQRLAQGGSTITQQLARNVYLNQRKTFQRKIQEAVLAILIERRYEKDRILEMYLNQVYYGSGAFGVQAASKVYFGKDVGQLTLSEAAMIAGMPKKPSAYSPHEDKEAAITRRDIVLNRMAELGMLTASERDEAKNKKLAIIPRAKGRSTYKAPHFVDYVAAQLRERYGEDVVYMGGLRVYTTLNYEMQKIAEKALREQIKRHRNKGVGEGCIIAIEPGNGYIRAMVGSVDPTSHFNRCTQAVRQPGSAFKAFVYTAAIEAGMKPTDRILDAPKSYPQTNRPPWRPKNYDNKWRGSVTMAEAVALSINMPAIRTAEKIGVRNVIDAARRLGIKSPLEPYLPLAIGGIGGVHPIEMASAYGTFANDGIHVEPVSITRVTNNHGDTIEDYIREGRRVISARTNQLMDEMLRGVVTRGTGRSVLNVPNARGKTGTTNDDRDAWWVGYIPHKLVAAVWVGNDDYTPMRRAWGGTVCAPVWEEFMLKAIPIFDKIHAEKKVAQARKPSTEREERERQPRENVRVRDTDPPTDEPVNEEDTVTATVCSDSQLLASSGCTSTYTQKFSRGSEPTQYCNLSHERSISEPRPVPRTPQPDPNVQLVTVTVCSESGLLAGRNCQTTRKRIPIDEVPAQVCTRHNRSEDR